MNMPYRDFAIRSAALQFCLDSDDLEADLDVAMNAARVTTFVENDNLVHANIFIDDQGPFVVTLNLLNGQIVRTQCVYYVDGGENT